MNYYNEIKNELINNEITKKVKDYSKNKSDLTTYYNVGKLLSEAGKHYDEGIIKEYSKRLTDDLGVSYTKRTLFRIRQFYLLFCNQKVSTLSTQLTWSHYSELLSINNIDEINYYIMSTEQKNLSVRELRKRIKNNEYEILDDKTKEKLTSSNETSVVDFIKNPIVIKNNTNKEIISEKYYKRLFLKIYQVF